MLADSLTSFHSRVGGAKDTIPDFSQEQDSMLGFLCELVGITCPSVSSVGASSLCPGDGVGSLGSKSGISCSCFGVASSWIRLPSSSSDASFSSPFVASFAPHVAPAFPPGSSFP